MSPKEAYKNSRALRTHLSQYNICTKQDVAPFPAQNLYKTVAKASKDLIPPPFSMRMHDVKERMKLTANKKVLQIIHSKGL